MPGCLLDGPVGKGQGLRHGFNVSCHIRKYIVIYLLAQGIPLKSSDGALYQHEWRLAKLALDRSDARTRLIPRHRLALGGRQDDLEVTRGFQCRARNHAVPAFVAQHAVRGRRGPGPPTGQGLGDRRPASSLGGWARRRAPPGRDLLGLLDAEGSADRYVQAVGVNERSSSSHAGALLGLERGEQRRGDGRRNAVFIACDGGVRAKANGFTVAEPRARARERP